MTTSYSYFTCMHGGHIGANDLVFAGAVSTCQCCGAAFGHFGGDPKSCQFCTETNAITDLHFYDYKFDEFDEKDNQ